MPQDLAAAERWLLHSANAGYDSAKIELGVEYTTGVRFKQNADAAIHWLTEASKNMVLAAFRLGEIYRKGEIVPRNPEKAIEWFTEAAEQGNEDGQWSLGKMYANGHGVEEDNELTLPLFSRLHKLPTMRISCLAAGPRSSVAQTSWD